MIELIKNGKMIGSPIEELDVPEADTYVIKPLAPMRGIKQAIEEIKAQDENTGLTERTLRGLVKTGIIPSIKVGKKHLINMNVLNEYLYGGNTNTTQDMMIIKRQL